MVQLAVLTPFHEYEKWNGTQGNLYDDLLQGLSAFYDKQINSINRWLPELEEDLDKSEEQKKEKVMDSWYLHHPLMNLARLALQGDKTARKLVLDSIEYVVKVAHHFKYEWPVFYKMETLEVAKEETAEGEGGENDVAGSYAHLMLLVFKLTKEKRYLAEAEKGASKLAEWGTNVFYQANNTAFSAGALLELYKLTNNKIYLETSYACLAGLFSNMQIWDCQYGNGKNYKNFFSIFPLKDAPYTAAYEEMEVYAALSEYLIQAKDLEILPSLRILIPEFVKYAVNRIACYYPALLPEDMLSGEVKTGEIQPNLWVPLEDLYTGWQASGQVGQEVYGAGLAFGIVPRQYIKLGDDFLIFIDYPLTRITRREGTVIITLDGDRHLSCSLKIIKGGNRAIKMEVLHNNKSLQPVEKNADMHQYEIPGQGVVKVQLIN